ncbi:MAG TPA: FkbM family methyltransferase, partial [Opitutaceae bacterium]|nr:FkbM family methyltransferase [Opitutaceae bacterium]
KPREVVMVPTQRLDSTARELKLKRIDVLKIDVEGFEYAVLEGAAGILARTPDPIVMYEVSPKNLDDKRREQFRKLFVSMAGEGWESWAYAIDRNELVQVETFDALVSGNHTNVFLGRSGSARLAKLRESYQGIVTTRLLPLALRRMIGAPETTEAEGNSPHSLQRLLWNSFINDLTARLHQHYAQLKSDAMKVQARLEASAGALEHERAQREQANQRGEQHATEAAKLLGRLEQLQEERTGHETELKTLRSAVEAERQRVAAMTHDLKELNVIIQQRDAARMAAEGKLAAETSRALAAESAAAELRKVGDTDRQRASALEQTISELRSAISEKERGQVRLEERIATETRQVEETIARLGEARQGCEAERQKANQLGQKIAELQRVIEQRDAAQVELERKLAAESGRVAEAMGLLETQKQEVEAGRKGVASLELQVRDLHTIIKQRDAARVQAEEKLATHIHDAAAREGRLSHEAEVLRAEVAEGRKLLEQRLQEFKQAESERARLEAEGRELSARHAAAEAGRLQAEQKLAQALSAAKAQEGNLTQEIERHRQEAAEAAGRLQQVRSDLAKIEADCARLQTEAKDLRQKGEAAEAQRVQLEERHAAAMAAASSRESQLTQERDRQAQGAAELQRRLDQALAARSDAEGKLTAFTAEALARENRLQQQVEQGKQAQAQIEQRVAALQAESDKREAGRIKAEERAVAESMRANQVAAQAALSLAEHVQRTDAERQRSTKLEQELRELRAQLEQRNAELSKEKAQAVEAAAKAAETVAVQAGRIAALDQQVRDQSVAFDRQRAEQKSAAEQQLANQKKQMDGELAGQKATMERQLAEQKATMERRLTEQKAAMERLVAEQKAALERQIADLKADIDRREKESVAAAAKATEEAAKAAQAVATRESQLATERQRVTALEQLMGELRATIGRLETERSKLQEKANADATQAARALADLSKKLESERQQAQKLAQELESVRKKAAELEHDVSELHVIIRQRDGVRVRAEEELARELNRFQEERKAAEQALAAANVEIERLSLEKHRLEAEYNATLGRRVQKWLNRT